jgi:hypothetical protein
MRLYELPIAFILIAALLIFGCGGESESTGGANNAEFLPDNIDATGFERSSEVETYVGESLFEYIDGGAEVYHQYGFIEVATAYYTQDQTEIVADIYRFEDSDNAYGLFSSLRPLEPTVVDYGIEGFTSGTTVDFVKGSYLVRLVGYDDSPELSAALLSMAKEFDGLVPGETTPPQMFALFPVDGRVESTLKIQAESFLGQKALTDVYTVDYFADGETVTLFLTNDATGEKYAQWSELAVKRKTTALTLRSFPYDESKVFMAEDSYYGQIIAGIKGEKLCGIVGYDERRKDLLISWLNSMQ